MRRDPEKPFEEWEADVWTKTLGEARTASAAKNELMQE